MIKRIRDEWKYPHIRAISRTILVLIITGIASVALYKCCGAISAILASICAGCVTGIVFYVITNKRNNEIRAINEEFEDVNKNYQKAREIMHLCSDTATSVPGSEKTIQEICELTNELITYMGTLCYDAPKTTNIIKDFPSDYFKRIESVSAAVKKLEKESMIDDNEKQITKALMELMNFCFATEDILLEPKIELMSEISHLEKAVF